MKTIEIHHGGNWVDRVLNAWPLCLDMDCIETFAFAWDAQGRYFPEDYSLFYNGYVFVRLTWPPGFWLHIKVRPAWRLQCGAGWKLNGRFGLILRIQRDDKAAAGAHENAPNHGQAAGFARGTA